MGVNDCGSLPVFFQTSPNSSGRVGFDPAESHLQLIADAQLAAWVFARELTDNSKKRRVSANGAQDGAAITGRVNG